MLSWFDWIKLAYTLDNVSVIGWNFDRLQLVTGILSFLSPIILHCFSDLMKLLNYSVQWWLFLGCFDFLRKVRLTGDMTILVGEIQVTEYSLPYMFLGQEWPGCLLDPGLKNHAGFFRVRMKLSFSSLLLFCLPISWVLVVLWYYVPISFLFSSHSL